MQALLFVGVLMTALSVAAIVSMRPDHHRRADAVPTAAEIEAALQQQVFNAASFDAVPVVARRYNLTEAQVRAIIERGHREQWEVKGLGSVSASQEEAANARAADIAQLETSGLLKRLDCEGHEAYVAPVIWLGINVDTKRGVASALARACGGRIRIYDYQSGRKLATFGALGFSVE